MDGVDPDIQIMAERLKVARQALGWSQKYASEVSRVSQAGISHYESGHWGPRCLCLKRLAVAYGVSLDWICGLSDAGGPGSSR